MRLIRKFDPWGNKLCTCPPKYSFSPYTGCQHACLYCYASSYIPNFFKCRAKKDVLSELKKDLRKLDKTKIISIANSSDPYVPLEEKLKLTRNCLKLLKDANCKVLIITKSDLVKRDVGLLRKMKALVSLTLTTLSEEKAKKLEPKAPSPQKRLETVKCLSKKGIKVSVRLDPIIPKLNEEEVFEIIKEVAENGAVHLISSTYKVRFDNWKRMCKEFTEVRKLKSLYFRYGERFNGYFYLPKQVRFKLLRKVKLISEKFGLSFACCREGFPELNSAICDGSHLIYEKEN